MLWRRAFVGRLYSLLFCASHAYAQGDLASVTRRVSDKGDAVVAATAITIVNVNTQVATSSSKSAR